MNQHFNLTRHSQRENLESDTRDKLEKIVINKYIFFSPSFFSLGYYRGCSNSFNVVLNIFS